MQVMNVKVGSAAKPWDEDCPKHLFPKGRSRRLAFAYNLLLELIRRPAAPSECSRRSQHISPFDVRPFRQSTSGHQLIAVVCLKAARTGGPWSLMYGHDVPLVEQLHDTGSVLIEFHGQKCPLIIDKVLDALTDSRENDSFDSAIVRRNADRVAPVAGRKCSDHFFSHLWFGKGPRSLLQGVLWRREAVNPTRSPLFISLPRA